MKVTLRAPSQTEEGQRINVSYIVNTQDIDDFHVGEFLGFEILYGPSKSSQSSYSWVNGKATSSSTITFTYTALDGYTLNPLQIESDPADSYTFTGSTLTDVTGNITISASATPNNNTQYSVFFYY